MNRSQIVWISIALAAIALCVWLLLSKSKPAAKIKSTLTGGSGSINCGFPLKLGNGTPCNEIKDLQRALNQPYTIEGTAGFEHEIQPLEYLVVDGIWGPKTQTALENSGHEGVTLEKTEWEYFLKRADNAIG